MIVAIAGATGLTGHLCLNLLIAEPWVTGIIAIGRNPSGISHPKLKDVIMKNGLISQTVHADLFICCIGTTLKKAGSKLAFREIDFALPVQLACTLKKDGCKAAVVMSAMGASTSSSFFYNRTKGEMEELIGKIGFESLSIVRPFFIDGKHKEARPSEKLMVAFLRLIRPVLIGPLANYKSVKAEIIAGALVNLGFYGKPGKTIYLSGEINDLARIISVN
jgi:uncharacterized protein YbjT (DUF2867 family)